MYISICALSELTSSNSITEVLFNFNSFFSARTSDCIDSSVFFGVLSNKYLKT